MTLRRAVLALAALAALAGAAGYISAMRGVAAVEAEMRHRAASYPQSWRGNYL